MPLISGAADSSTFSEDAPLFNPWKKRTHVLSDVAMV